MPEIKMAGKLFFKEISTGESWLKRRVLGRVGIGR